MASLSWVYLSAADPGLTSTPSDSRATSTGAWHVLMIERDNVTFGRE